jgi:hypothetical protein
VIDPRTPGGRKLSRGERKVLFAAGIALLLAGYAVILLGTP